MSLLMDALRKAEQQKRQGREVAVDPADHRLRLDPLPAQASVSSPPASEIDEHLPELPKRMEELDDQFITSDPALQKSIRALADTKMRETLPAPPAGMNMASTSREAAQNVFAAKQPAPAIGHGFAITVGIVTLIAVTAIGGYFYWQMRPTGGISAGPALTAQQTPVPVPYMTTTPPPAPVDQISATPAEPAPPVAMPPARARAPHVESADDRSRAPLTLASAAQPIENPDLVIRPGARSGKVDNAMETAHAAFLRGETDLARSLWLKALQSDSRNLYALQGLAAIAQQEGKAEQAAVLYRRVLEIDPKDAAAHAGLLSVSAPVDPRQTESRLKGLLAEQPDSPHLNFALGNLYLNEARWSEARQAFFKAHVADAANPDYLHNLAVSLDHLHQAGLAAQYYARALVAAKSQAAAFDPAQVEERLRTLRNERQH